MCELQVGNYIYNQEPNGTWTFKAKEPEALKVDGTLKKQYKELPQYDVIYDIDAHMRGQMDNEIKIAVKEILNELKP
jgi:oxalate decarboxylase/phosphoglucose isomerase-like protein (cupin superfamily)